MPVKGITPRLLELGKIKIGVKGAQVTSSKGTEFRPPEKLDHFVLTTTEKDANGDYFPDTALMDALKKRPKANIDERGNLVGIPVKLLYNDPDKNFPTRYAAYAGARLICQGDGEKGFEEGKEKECPCRRLEPGFEGKGKCKINGVLTVLIDGQDCIGGCHKFRTTSVNTVSSILGSLQLLHIATGGNVAFVPLELVVKPKSTAIPGTGAPTTVYVVSLVFRGDVKKLQEIAFKNVQDGASYRALLAGVEAPASPLPETDEEAAEIMAEFYPDAVAVQAPVQAEPESMKPAVTSDPAVKAPPAVDPHTEPVTVDRSMVVPDSPPESSHVAVNGGAAPAPEPVPASTPDMDTAPLSAEQKIAIKKHKVEMGITDPAAWATYVQRHTGKSSALALTHNEAAAFLRAVGADIPF